MPVDGLKFARPTLIDSGRLRIEIDRDESSAEAGVVVTVIDPNASSRVGGTTRRMNIRCDQPIDQQLLPLWQELGYASIAA